MENEICKLKAVAEKSCSEQSLNKDEDKEKHDNIISALKKEIVNMDHTIKTLIEKCEGVEKEVNDKTNEIKKLEKVAGEMFYDLRELKAPYFNNIEKDANETAQKETKHATSSENEEHQVECLAQQGGCTALAPAYGWQPVPEVYVLLCITTDCAEYRYIYRYICMLSMTG